MQESQVTEQLVAHWLPVVDSSGRTRMEAVWVCVPTAQSAPAVTYAA